MHLYDFKVGWPLTHLNYHIQHVKMYRNIYVERLLPYQKANIDILPASTTQLQWTKSISSMENLLKQLCLPLWYPNLLPQCWKERNVFPCFYGLFQFSRHLKLHTEAVIHAHHLPHWLVVVNNMSRSTCVAAATWGRLMWSNSQIMKTESWSGISSQCWILSTTLLLFIESCSQVSSLFGLACECWELSSVYYFIIMSRQLASRLELHPRK